MVVVHVPNGVPLQQVEGFPLLVDLKETETVVVRGRKVEQPKTREFKRSQKGALHVRPRSTMTLTEDELAWLKQHRKPLFTKLRVTADKDLTRASAARAAKKAPEEPKPVPAPPGDPPPDPPATGPSGSGSSKGSGKGSKGSSSK